MSKFREKVNKNCKSCIYDPYAAGTWRQQTTLCTVINCPFHEVRPVTESEIPVAVLDYYQVSEGEYQKIRLQISGEGKNV